MAKYQSINFRMLVKVIGWLVLIEAAFMTAPLITSLIYGETDFMAFAVSLAIAVGVGCLMTFCSRPRRSDMGKREGFLLTGLVWVVFSFVGMVPFLICRHPLGFTDAFFEAMSAFTTTGATSFPNLDHLSHAVHMWRVVMQWTGGMGIIIFTLAVIPMLNSSGGMQMFNAEATGITSEKISPRVSSTAKRLWLVYAAITFALILLYWIGPMDLFNSICHGFATMSTGGFSTFNLALHTWDSLYIKIVTTIFMFLGGVNFVLIFKASIGDFRGVWRNEIFRFYVWVILALFILFDIAILFNPAVPNTLENLTIDPLFQIVSSLSSTGYEVRNLGQWGPFILCLIFIMMFFGACAGSTTGGAKLDRALYLWKNARNEVYRCIYPNRVLAVNVNGRTATPEIINKVLVFLCLYVVIIAAGSGALTAFGFPLIDSLFAALSCMSNTSLGPTVMGHVPDFAAMHFMVKWILCALMLIGRLEIFTILVLLTPGFWRK